MPQSLRQLNNRRLVHRVSKEALAKEMNCSYRWVDTLSRHLYDGPSLPRWRDEYESALVRLIEKKKSEN